MCPSRIITSEENWFLYNNMAKKIHSKELKIIVFTSILLVLGSIFLIWIYPDNPQPPINPINNTTNNSTNNGSTENEFRNGAFINIWIDGPATLRNLQNHNVKFLIVDVGHVNKAGKLETTDREIDDFLEHVRDYEKSNNYNFEIQPYSELILQNYDFTKNFQDNVIQDYVKLNNKGFDGVSVDVEAIPENKRQDYLNFLDNLRIALPGKTISAYAGMINDNNPNEWEWTYPYFKEVSNKVDIVLLSSYDFNIKDKQSYQNYLLNQLEKATSQPLSSKIVLNIPTHKREPETISNALEVFNSFKDKGKLSGVVVFAEWTTDREEWKVFENFVNP